MTSWSQLQSADSVRNLFPTSYFPPISYFVLARQYAGITIDGCEHYIKQTVRNRADILSANGVLSLVVPVLRNKEARLSSQDVLIDYKTLWQRNHLRAIRSAYGKTAYFDYYFPEIENIIMSSPEKLIELNTRITTWVFDKMNLKIELTKTKEYIAEIENDFRNIFSKRNKMKEYKNKPYFQAFCDRFQFVNDLSCLDLLFNMGSESSTYL